MNAAPTPMVAWALAAIAGGWIAWSFKAPGPVLAGVGLLAAVLALRTRHRPIRLVAAAGVVLAGSMLLTGLHLRALERGPLLDLARHGGSSELVGLVVTDPRPTDSGWWTFIRVARVGDRADRQRAFWRGSGDGPELGATVRLMSSARPLGNEDFDDWLRSRHVAATLDPSTWEQVHPPGWFHASTNWVRQQVRDRASGGLGGAAAGLAVGLVTGDTSLLPDADVERMQATGLSHLTAVSGSNVAIVLAGALVVVRALGLRGRVRRLVIVVVLAWFAVLTRLEPSVLRASAMAGVVLLAQARGHQAEPVHALSAATLLLVLVDPFLARSLGLLLSVSATAGLLIVAPLVGRRLTGLPGPVRVLVATSIGAQVAVAPVLLATTDEVPVVTVVANVIAVPAAAVASTLALFGATVGLVLAPVGVACFWLSAAPLEVILWAARVLVGRGPTLAAGLPALVAAALTGWLLSRPRSVAARRWARLAAALALVVGVPVGLGTSPSVRWLTVTAIDVGQGDAILVEAPGVSILVDGGANDAAAAWLAANGRDRLDLVVVSHPDFDHVGGLPAVVAATEVGSIWWRPLPDMNGAADELAAIAAARGIVMHQPQAGDRVRVRGLTIEVLGPPQDRPYRWADAETNEMSIVLRAGWQGRHVLLTGDVEEAAQADLLQEPGRLAADVLKVPHHGAGTSTRAFLEAAAAPVAIIPVGRDNSYGHPHPDVLAVLAASGSRVRRTDLEGTVRVELPPRGHATATDVAAPSWSLVRSRGFVESPRVHPACRRRRCAARRPRTGSDPRPVDPGRRCNPRAGPRGRRARAPPRAAHPVPVRRFHRARNSRCRTVACSRQARADRLPRGPRRRRPAGHRRRRCERACPGRSPEGGRPRRRGARVACARRLGRAGLDTGHHR
ncbi:MAG: DNA internalization-related competence protein ComEC/Rec2 [Nitriliruptorales bacterium]|nr:DNA internalization-related competence protein ComEC/Rec2 [Nitriliruptorales bacterium]